MKAVELLKIFREPLNLMSKNGILLEDYKYVEAYEHFLQMRMCGVKYRVANSLIGSGVAFVSPLVFVFFFTLLYIILANIQK